jgi:hypothetical protein
MFQKKIRGSVIDIITSPINNVISSIHLLKEKIGMINKQDCI